jgi:hypothetical protein
MLVKGPAKARQKLNTLIPSSGPGMTDISFSLYPVLT